MRNYTFDENIVSDLYKDAYGHRPGEYFWADWDACSDDAKQHLWDRLIDAVGESIREEQRYHEMAIHELESWIISTKKIVFESTREDCIRMLHDAHETRGDVEYLEHCLGVPYGYLSGKNWG